MFPKKQPRIAHMLRSFFLKQDGENAPLGEDKPFLSLILRRREGEPVQMICWGDQLAITYRMLGERELTFLGKSRQQSRRRRSLQATQTRLEK